MSSFDTRDGGGCGEVAGVEAGRRHEIPPGLFLNDTTALVDHLRSIQAQRQTWLSPQWEAQAARLRSDQRQLAIEITRLAHRHVATTAGSPGADRADERLDISDVDDLPRLIEG